jgi:crotonobetainyl-CoA:carnitine CoA-transferase CaiB-like acyl-CoA transferase
VLGRPDLVTDARFSTRDALTENAFVASQILQDEFGSRTMTEWRERLADFKGQWSPVQDTLEVAEDPQVLANGYLQEAKTKEGTPFQLVATPVQFDEEPAVPARAPEFNEHGDEILTDLLGRDWDAVIDLKLKGVVA